ncbi:radical SAM protein [Nocardiopsis sp. NPDC050513]|uniref:radical SAM protein n=1 Tax=Nocardiopsis sp. NPDC050513 TaxID=3364338 RepID=UPI00378D80AB
MSANPTMPLTVADVVELAEQHAVPVEDALLIAINLHGIASEHQRHRARVHLRLRGAPQVPWMVIVPLNAAASPFHLIGDELLLGGEPIADVERIDADEAVGGYFRDGGRAATLNPNARSRCTGCAFCPNTLEASADPRLAEERGLRELLSALAEQHPRGDLSELREATVSTGCFEREDLALGHLAALRSALTEQGVGARIGLLTSVLRSRRAFEELGRTTTPFVLRLTVECFTRRDLLLKASKTELDRARMPEVLRLAKEAGHDTSFTYIVGLDDLASLEEGVAALVPHTTEFPNFQIYQAHNTIMSGLRVPGAGELEFYLRARRTIETIMGPSGLRPVAWECYRPLWYFTFDGEPLVEV